MKKSAYIFAASLALATVLSCNRAIEPEEAVTPQPAAETLTFRAVLEQPDTKASLNSDYAVVWEAGDQIAVYNGTEWVSSEPLTDSDIENNGRYATFSVNIAEGDTYYAVYPASAAPSAAVSEDVLAVTLPDVQVIPSGGCVAKDALVQVCKTSDKDNMVFKNISSLVEFKAPEALDGYVRFEAFDAEGTALQVAGAASVNAAAPAAVSGNAGKVIVKGSFAAEQNYFAVVYPQSGVSSFRFAFSKEDATNGTLKAFKTGSSAIDLPLNGGKKFSDLGTLKWLGPLSTKADLDKWAKYSSYYLAGETVKLGADIDYEGGTWKPVNGNDATGFAGCLDGQGHSIFGIMFPLDIEDYTGFFSTLVSSEKCLRVKNLKLGYDASSETGYDDTKCLLRSNSTGTPTFGPLAGLAENCVIENVDNYVRTILGGAAEKAVFGGIFGKTSGNCELNHCTNNNIVACTATALDTYIGGLIGEAGGSVTIIDCENKGDIKRTQTSKTIGSGIVLIGGIAGRTSNDSQGHSITNCNNSGTISVTANLKCGQLHVGGILGIDGSSTDGSWNVIIDQCKNSGKISCNGQSGGGDQSSGGIIGKVNHETKIINSTNAGAIVKNGNGNNVEFKVGGIVGMLSNESGIILNCTNGIQGDATKGKIADEATQDKNYNQRLGGIVGHANIGTIQECRNYATINSTTSCSYGKTYIGGITGNCTLANIVDCENYGTVHLEAGSEVSSSAGGIVGLQNGSKNANYVDGGCKVSSAIYCGNSANAGLIVGRFSNSVEAVYGSETKPNVVLSGCTINDTTIDASNYLTYLAGTAAGITASGVASGLNTIWATFVSE